MKTGKWSIQKLIYTAMLAAVAGVLMSLEFSVPMMPPFYKVDFSDVPSVIAVFLMGPVSGICACFINANITLPLYAKAMSLPLDEVIRMVASVNPAIKDRNGFIILATIPFNVLKVGLNYIVGQLLFVRLRAAKIVPKAV